MSYLSYTSQSDDHHNRIFIQENYVKITWTLRENYVYVFNSDAGGVLPEESLGAADVSASFHNSASRRDATFPLQGEEHKFKSMVVLENPKLCRIHIEVKKILNSYLISNCEFVMTGLRSELLSKSVHAGQTQPIRGRSQKDCSRKCSSSSRSSRRRSDNRLTIPTFRFHTTLGFIRRVALLKFSGIPTGYT